MDGRAYVNTIMSCTYIHTYDVCDGNGDGMGKRKGKERQSKMGRGVGGIGACENKKRFDVCMGWDGDGDKRRKIKCVPFFAFASGERNVEPKNLWWEGARGWRG